MRYSLFGNDELGWTVAKSLKKMIAFISFWDFEIETWMECIDESGLTTKEKAEAKLKELQDA